MFIKLRRLRCSLTAAASWVWATLAFGAWASPLGSWSRGYFSVGGWTWWEFTQKKTGLVRKSPQVFSPAWWLGFRCLTWTFEVLLVWIWAQDLYTVCCGLSCSESMMRKWFGPQNFAEIMGLDSFHLQLQVLASIPPRRFQWWLMLDAATPAEMLQSLLAKKCKDWKNLKKWKSFQHFFKHGHYGTEFAWSLPLSHRRDFWKGLRFAITSCTTAWRTIARNTHRKQEQRCQSWKLMKLMKLENLGTLHDSPAWPLNFVIFCFHSISAGMSRRSIPCTMGPIPSLETLVA